MSSSDAPIALPSIDSETEKTCFDHDVQIFYHIFHSFVESGHGKLDSSETKWTGFTVNDQTFATSRPMDTVDPLMGDPETQKILMQAQISLGKVDKNDAKINGDGLKITMLNGKEITLVKKDGKLMANDMEINKVITSENATIFVMDYFLFISGDDISAGIKRIHKKEGVVHTPWGSHPYEENDS